MTEARFDIFNQVGAQLYEMIMTDADLNFLTRQNERLITDVASLRDDMRVLTAIAVRLDNTRDRHEALLTDMLREIQPMNARSARTDDRLRRLEDANR